MGEIQADNLSSLRPHDEPLSVYAPTTPSPEGEPFHYRFYVNAPQPPGMMPGMRLSAPRSNLQAHVTPDSITVTPGQPFPLQIQNANGRFPIPRDPSPEQLAFPEAVLGLVYRRREDKDGLWLVNKIIDLDTQEESPLDITGRFALTAFTHHIAVAANIAQRKRQH